MANAPSPMVSAISLACGPQGTVQRWFSLINEKRGPTLPLACRPRYSHGEPELDIHLVRPSPMVSAIRCPRSPGRLEVERWFGLIVGADGRVAFEILPT